MTEDSMKAVDKKDRRLALVIVDVQKKFIVGADDRTLDSARLHTPMMLSVIDRFRKAGKPVIWVLYEGPTHQKGITDETYELLDGFSIDGSDTVVIKHHMNSFNGTDLAGTILSKGCDAALLMGMFAQHCVMSTYWGAFDCGVSPYMMKGGLISTQERFCDLAVELCKYYTSEELDENLECHGSERSPMCSAMLSLTSLMEMLSIFSFVLFAESEALFLTSLMVMFSNLSLVPTRTALRTALSQVFSILSTTALTSGDSGAASMTASKK